MNLLLQAIGLICVIINSSFAFGDVSPPISITSPTSKPILVVGSTGRVGQSIVQKLRSKGLKTRVLIRREEDRVLFPNEEVFIGDVTSYESIKQATKDVSCVISVQGMKPPRISKFRDLFQHPSKDLTHPYNVNFIGTKNIVDACKVNNVLKVVRLTGALTGKPANLPFIVIFNLLLSFSPKWHEMSENYIRSSGINYSVVRPTELKNDPTAAESNRSLILIQGDSGLKPPIPGKISISDVSDLCILSATDNKFDFSSVICSSTDRLNEYKDWNTLSQELELKDYKKLNLQPHTRIALVSGTIFVGFVSALLTGLLLCIKTALNYLVNYLPYIIGEIIRAIVGWKNVVKIAFF